MEEDIRPKDTPAPNLGNPSTLEEIDFAPLIDYFGMERPSLEEKNDLRTLHSLLPGKDAIEKLHALRKYEIKVGYPPTSENRMRRIIRMMEIEKDLDNKFTEFESYMR